MRKILLLLIVICGYHGHAQVKVGDDPTTIHSSSLLELEHTDKALLVTRVAVSEDIETPVNGMIIYVLSEDKFKVYQDNKWVNLFN